MGFLTNILGAAVKVVVTPVAIVKDVVDTVSGDIPDTTRKLVSSAVDDIEEGFDDLMDGDLI